MTCSPPVSSGSPRFKVKMSCQLCSDNKRTFPSKEPIAKTKDELAVVDSVCLRGRQKLFTPNAFW